MAAKAGASSVVAIRYGGTVVTKVYFCGQLVYTS